MGAPKNNLRFGVPVASADGRYYTRWPRGDKPFPQGAGATVSSIAANGSASGGTGGSSPPIGSENFNFATQSPTATSSVLDLREDFTQGGRDNVLWLTSSSPYLVRAPTYTFMPSGGYYGQGCGRFVPGYLSGDSNDPLGQHVAGLGQFLNFDAVGDARIVTIGILWRFGSGWLSEQNGHKHIIMLRRNGVRRDNGQPRSTRPMVIPKGVYSSDSGTLVLPPCDGTLCNADDDYRAAGELNYFNDPPVSQPNINIKYEQHVYSEFSVDVLQDPGIMHTRMWSADGAYDGTQILRTYLWGGHRRRNLRRRQHQLLQLGREPVGELLDGDRARRDPRRPVWPVHAAPWFHRFSALKEQHNGI